MEHKQKDLILNVLRYSDSKVLDLIEQKIQIFTDMIETDGLKDGTKWDDIILHLEWQNSFEHLIAQQNENQQMVDILQQASQSLRYCFNDEMFSEWMASS